jgi:hypothetical protein
MFIESANLTIKNRFGLQLGQGMDDRRKAFGEVVVSPGVQPKASARLSLCDSAKAVPLQFKNPSIAVEWFLTSLATMGVITYARLLG